MCTSHSAVQVEAAVRRLIIVISITLALLLSILSCTHEVSPVPPEAPTKPAPALVPAPAPILTERTQATVVRVIDGDTIEVDIGGRSYRVRYIGVDTPERGQVGYDEATLANAQLVSGRVVELEKDISETDKYGRLLRYVWVEEGMVNAILVASGYAQVSTYPPDVKYQEEFLELQRQAEQTGMGLWTAPQPSPQVEIAYVGSIKSDKYHYPSCRYVGQIYPENLIGFSSAAEAKAMGYVPCKGCNPPLRD